MDLQTAYQLFMCLNQVLKGASIINLNLDRVMRFMVEHHYTTVRKSRWEGFHTIRIGRKRRGFPFKLLIIHFRHRHISGQRQGSSVRVWYTLLLANEQVKYGSNVDIMRGQIRPSRWVQKLMKRQITHHLPKTNE